MARKGILGTKLGMTQVFDENNRVVPVTVVKAGRKFEEVAKNEMQESISASPVFANGRLYVRTFDALYAIGKSTVPTNRASLGVVAIVLLAIGYLHPVHHCWN